MMATGKEEEVAEVFFKPQVLLSTIEKEDEEYFIRQFSLFFRNFSFFE